LVWSIAPTLGVEVNPLPQAAPALQLEPIPVQLNSATPVDQRPVETLIIGVDLSRSNPIIRNADFARKVGARVRGMIAPLGPRSRVVLRTFGSYDTAANQRGFDQVITLNAFTATNAADLAGRLVEGVPALVRTGKWKAQNETNIIGFLDNMAKVANCGAMTTRIVLASDGIEDSEFANLARPKKGGALALPAPKPKADGTPQFAGCTEFLVLGIGQGTGSPKDTERLSQEWQAYATAAGFKQVTLLNDW
ncbi:MAG TPA: hypothetical protein DCL54_16235, partial [Alphaproteobacteria bacterium]|nr:hypothetical protein [Alphaproteobacteria bacterium]